MGLAAIISAIWVGSLVAFFADGSPALASICGVFALAPPLLTLYTQRLGRQAAARAYLAQQRERGISATEARERVHELAADGVTYDTDDVPNWPINVLLLLAPAGVVMLVIAVVSLL